MKKVLIILGVLLAMVILAGTITPAFADDDVNAGKLRGVLCDEWLMGTIDSKSGTAANGDITLAAHDGGAQITISVDGSTTYRSWMRPAESVIFESLKAGDWIAVCVKDDLAGLVILLKPPQISPCIRLVGNVTYVNGDTVTVTIGNGSTFTISGISGVMTGQPVSLTIGRCVPFLGQCFPGLHLGWFVGKGNEGIGPWFKNNDFQGKLEQFREKFRDRFEQRFHNWQERSEGDED